MNNQKLKQILTASLVVAATATLTLLPACSTVPGAQSVTETDFTVSGGYTDPATKNAYTGSATAAIKYAPAPASPNVATGATAASPAAPATPASSPSTAPSSSQPAQQ